MSLGKLTPLGQLFLGIDGLVKEGLSEEEIVTATRSYYTRLQKQALDGLVLTPKSSRPSAPLGLGSGA